MGVINFTFIFTFKRVKSSTSGQHMTTKALASIFVTTADDFIVRPKTLKKYCLFNRQTLWVHSSSFRTALVSLNSFWYFFSICFRDDKAFLYYFQIKSYLFEYFLGVLVGKDLLCCFPNDATILFIIQILRMFYVLASILVSAINISIKKFLQAISNKLLNLLYI